MIDLKILDNIGSQDSETCFDIINNGPRATGKVSVSQRFCRLLYGSDCGGLLDAYKTIKLSNKNVGLMHNTIISALSKTSEKMLKLQENEELLATETFVRAKLKNLDIIITNGQVNMSIELVTLDGVQQLEL